MIHCETHYGTLICLQVETVFHEFGHALQHMLTKQDDGLVAGIRGIEWDAVELPSQFMENWCYHRYLPMFWYSLVFFAIYSSYYLVWLSYVRELIS